MGFRLIRLNISGHPILKNTTVVFCDDRNESSVVYTTGIIGANGTGKSYLMGAIASIFADINKAKATGNYGNKRFSFDIDYEFDGDRFNVKNFWEAQGFRLVDANPQHISIYAKKNGRPISIDCLDLPQQVIASTMTVTDKFVARSDSFYRYKGIRNEKSASTTGTRTIIRKTVDSLMDCMSKKSEFQEELSMLLNNLGLEEHLHVSYGMRYKNIFLRTDMTSDMLRNLFDDWSNTFGERANAPWGYNNYLRLRENKQALSAAASFLAKYARQHERGRSVVVSYDVMTNPIQFREDAEALKVLAQLDLVSFPSINVVKKGLPFIFENSSSGETHLLCQFIGIMADIKHDSLILIDEPENSSHPDWQMNYVDWVKDIFKEYRDCHFVIATHSPLILANMKSAESTIVRLKRNEGNRIMDEGGMERGCYSWTVDEILQDVMEMKNNRTKEYQSAMGDFEKALGDDDKEMAQKAYNRLIPLIKPGNVLAELLRIQMIGLTDKND